LESVASSAIASVIATAPDANGRNSKKKDENAESAQLSESERVSSRTKTDENSRKARLPSPCLPASLRSRFT
jgi:hypothetical protein